MARRLHLLLVVALAGMVLSGCKDARKALGGSGCASGETTNEDPPFCHRIPEGMKPKGDTIRREGHFQIGFQGDGGRKIAFVVRELATFDATWKALRANAERAKATDAKEEELDGGKTRVLTYSTPEKSPRWILSVVTRGATHLLECEAEAPKDAKTDDLLAACKALHQP